MDSFTLQSIILILGVVTFALSQYGGKMGSPTLILLSRWSRWAFMAFAVGGLISLSGWAAYPSWVLILVSFLGWFVIETAYNWLAIQALSRSDLPLFPRFEVNELGDQWPSDNRFIKIKDQLRREGFSKVQSLVSHLNDQILMRMVAYENLQKTVRLNILFFPNHRGTHTVCFSLFSETKKGLRLITDNIFLPFGGFYPENWEVERKPLTRSLDKLLYRHHARMDAVAQEFAKIEEEPLYQLNDDQTLLEKLNRDLGFLHKRSVEMETGKLTPAGRARIWQEIWTLSYLGKSLPYH